MARQFVSLGMYIGFTGTITFPNAKKPAEAAAAVPLDRILLETDCPYMAPVPNRGRRCDSTMLPHTAEALAKAHGVTVDELIKAAWQNAFGCFELGEWQPHW